MRGFGTLLVVVAMAAPVAAEPTEGAKLFDEGRDLAKQNRFAEACDKFDKSYALDNGVGTELNLADCHEHLGHYAAAYRLFDDAASRLAGDNRQKFARDRADALVAKLATAVVKLADPDASGISVTIAGRAVKPVAEISERVDPGTIAVHVTIPGKPAFDKSLSAAAGATVVFDTRVEKAAEPIRPKVAPAISTTSHRDPNRVTIAYTIGGIGVAAIAGGVVLGLYARSTYNDAVGRCTKTASGIFCDPADYSVTHTAGTYADVGTVIGAVGVAMVGGAVITYLTAPREIVVTPTASDTSAGVSISGRF